jgi:hypothetical protein
MATFGELKTRISTLGRAEYRYDRLVSDFAEHYLELMRADYKVLPDIAVFHGWLKHLHTEIRPSLLNAWRSMAGLYGFKLGDRISVEGSDVYAVRVSCYPLEDIVRFTGFGTKKDGKPSQSSVTVSVKENSVIQKHGQSLDEATLAPLYFEGSTRLLPVKKFLQDEIAKLP